MPAFYKPDARVSAVLGLEAVDSKADIMQRHPTLASNPMDGSNATAVGALSSTTLCTDGVEGMAHGWDEMGPWMPAAAVRT